jgi:hypothetical protein
MKTLIKNNSIDFVITWVDGSDEKWLEEKKKYQPDIDIDASLARYRDFGSLRYLFRSIEKFAPWVRNIFLVTNGQVPRWLNLEHPKVKLVKHSDYIPQEYLPTFSSHPIEWNFHRIEGLSENFVYFNDDVILTDYVKPTDFFKNDLPCDIFGLGMVKPREYFSSIPFNHMLILNKHFNFKTTLRKNYKKFFKLKYRSRLLKTLILSRQDVFYGMYDPHITLPFKKSFFELLWKKEGELIDATCKNKFRSKDDVSIWLVRYWQLLTGNFEPRSDKFGKFYVMNKFVTNKKIDKIMSKQQVICINDTNESALDFVTEHKMFENIMNDFLGEKSSFEK